MFGKSAAAIRDRGGGLTEPALQKKCFSNGWKIYDAIGRTRHLRQHLTLRHCHPPQLAAILSPVFTKMRHDAETMLCLKKEKDEKNSYSYSKNYCSVRRRHRCLVPIWGHHVEN
jgi:hypothetical protein